MSDPTTREEAEAADALLDSQIADHLEEKDRLRRGEIPPEDEEEGPMTNAQLEERMAASRESEAPDSGRPECGVCWTDAEHEDGYCRSEETVVGQAVDDRRVEEETVGWRVASFKQRAYLVALTFQKGQTGPNDETARIAMRRFVVSETCPAAGTSAFIDELVLLDYRTDIFFGKVEPEDGESIEGYLVRLVERETDRLSESEETPEDRPHEAPASVRDGYYTVVFETGQPSSGGSPDYVPSHRTIRVRTVSTGNLAGRTVVSYLAGPNNESDYVGFGFLSGTELGLWKRFQDESELVDAVAILVEDPEAAGRGYAAESGNCYVCGRTLTDPQSIDLGIGPICRGKESL